MPATPTSASNATALPPAWAVTTASRATGKELVLTADHDGVIVADVVEEWGRLHGQPFTLVLTGPAGGTWNEGGRGDDAHSSAPPDIELDAVEFCRILSGRGTGSGLLSQGVPF